MRFTLVLLLTLSLGAAVSAQPVKQIEVTNLPAVQEVAGSVEVTNLPAVQDVSVVDSVELDVIDSCVKNAIVNAKKGAAPIGGCISEGGAGIP